ncbi:MAG: hypothetical protein R2771_14020 [Saprospiraceae bacterium]
MQEFFNIQIFPIRLVEVNDTAEVAKKIYTNNIEFSRHTASVKAAEMYGLKY